MDRKYQQYSEEERGHLAEARLMRLIAKHGELHGMTTFLAFSFPGVGLAAKSGNRAQVELAIAKVRSDIQDVDNAANSFVRAYTDVLNDLEQEWHDSMQHEKETNPDGPS